MHENKILDMKLIQIGRWEIMYNQKCGVEKLTIWQNQIEIIN